ncbi:alpha/beta-hydrolase [Agrocybe pediades]|nr:alpha/beta-hydrolase [Agrocybe pediades]
MLPLWPLGLLAVGSAYATPSAQTLGSPLTLLFQNDLDWPHAPEHNGTIMISKAVTNKDAIASCGVLNESLLPTEGLHFASDIKLTMQYLALKDKKLAKQKFWVEASPARPCSAISLDHGIQSVSCNSKLPAFCSQSAPFRSNTNVDPNPNFHVQVQSKKLTVIGTRDALSFRFIGIPFADLFQRFTYSKVFSSTATINALSYGARCVQVGGGNEDCLFLNVYTPFLSDNANKSKKDLRPVMFWIHGGAFTGGESSDPVFDGGNLASRSDVVVVTIQYRLGAIGFLALEDGVTNGNFGLADQVTALQWVHEHIADFGGDPDRVTIFGESAGGSSVRALLATKPAFGLFQGAIAQSNLGGFGFASTYSNYFTIQEQFSMFAGPTITAVGCGNSTDVLACLRGVDPQTLINVPSEPKFIVVDGKFITTDKLVLNGKGPAANNAHVIFGWLRDDGADFMGAFPTSASTLTSSLLGAGFPFNVTQAAVNSPLFPMPQGSDPLMNLFNLTSRIGTDGQFVCINQATVQAAAKYSVFKSVYAFQFERSFGGFEPIAGICDPAKTAQFPFGDTSLPYYRCHAGELTYVFGTQGQSNIAFRDPGDLILEQATTDIWGAFARTFNPNPAADYLEARGYTNTTALLKKSGPWEPITTKSKTPLRIIDVPAWSSVPFREVEQCSVLGLPLTMLG